MSWRSPSLCLPCATATARYTLSLHDALPILALGPKHVAEWTFTFDAMLGQARFVGNGDATQRQLLGGSEIASDDGERSEEHTSELQSRLHLVCRLLPGKKNVRVSGGANVVKQ